MSDLISRKALKDFIINAIEKQNGRGIDLLKVSEVIEVIENQPTAFDTEKVIEQLESLSNAEADYYYARSNDVIDREDAIDIVKKGGVE